MTAGDDAGAPRPLPPTLRVFVDERPVDVPRGGTALDAARALDAQHAERIARGERTLVDSRGLPVDPGSPAFAGAIYRILPARRPSTAAGEPEPTA